MVSLEGTAGLLAVLLVSARAAAADPAPSAGTGAPPARGPRVIWYNTEPSSQPMALPPDTPAAPEPPRPTYRRWYGWQTLLADGLWVASASVQPALAPIGYLTFAPLVHAAHGHPGKPFASLGVRVGLPLGGLLLGAGAGAFVDGGEFFGAPLGLVSGLVGAIVMDAAVIANEDAPLSARSPRRAILWPNATVTANAASVGFAGFF